MWWSMLTFSLPVAMLLVRWYGCCVSWRLDATLLPTEDQVLCCTGVVGHGGLVGVALLLEAHVPQLEDGGHHLQHACRGAQHGG